MSLQFKLHVIRPPKPLDWSTPRSLLKDTLIHHILQDPFAIGHFYIEFDCPQPNPYRIARVLTGMSRQSKNISTLQVSLKNLGLGTFFHDFKGKLDKAEIARKHLRWAKKKHRLKTIQVEITPECAQILMDEMNLWIEAGSFQHYGGGHEISKGEGSGCAEFGIHFINLALGKKSAHPTWIRSVFAPKSLTGQPKSPQQISLRRLWREGHAWASNAEEGYLYATPDMDLVTFWLNENYPNQNEIDFKHESLAWAQQPATPISHVAARAKPGALEIKKIWAEIGFAS